MKDLAFCLTAILCHATMAELCNCLIANLSQFSGINATQPVFVLTSTEAEPHPQHDIKGDVSALLRGAGVTIKASDARALVTLVPNSNIPQRSYCENCAAYRHYQHDCLAPTSADRTSWTGDALHIWHIRNIVRTVLGVEQERFTTATAQADYLRMFYPQLVPAPPASEHRISTAFERLYDTSSRFRIGYLSWAIRQEHPVGSVRAFYIACWFEYMRPYKLAN
jgi:hypothetical protein